MRTLAATIPRFDALAPGRALSLAAHGGVCFLSTPMKKLLLLLVAAAPAFAQVTPATPSGFTTQATGTAAGVTATVTAKPKPLGAGDKKFVKDSLEGMYFVMELAGKSKTGAKLEGTKTESNALKADLDKVWAEVAGFASNVGEKVPSELTGGDKGKAERLGKAGDKFDKEFFKLVNKEVEKLAKVFENAGKSGQDPEIKKIATNWGAALKDHVAKLDAAEKEAAKSK